ncbi:hypothetical protein EJ05DRAFT_479018 [Pseudovirgaria hyperparasitica]|uniref:Autophagy-related protein 28 n=1 Tax=Pseudovirgaria hyperparasitica TaxID=470096 RepID=A0A6A6VZQ4_9PEZI|nr:uncharacterized protein EJ05DRAFT_479018 [Pseudovirgaria hyperparasitica]KAF2755224.1 hypothetical protein EJ05DRAFT_479018 [Pseudovirgaria hyperparasitica]
MQPFSPPRQLRSTPPRPQLETLEHELATLPSNMSTRRSSSTRSSNFSPPPPVTASIYRPSASIRIDSNTQIHREPDNVLALRRQEKALEDELQELLDAQSEGLFKVLGGGTAEEDASSTGTSTPTLASGLRGRDMSPAERYKPKKKKPGLAGARRGIYKSIQRLAAVKTEEASLVANDLRVNESVLERIGTWELKRERLSQKTNRIEHASSGQRAQDIQHEAQRLEAEIQELEEKLRDMRARHRQLLDDAAATENAVQSKLSSYKAALSMLESDIDSFLKRPPLLKSTSSASRESTFLKLPSNRRTLGLARDHWNEEHASLEAKSQQITSVHETLSEGAAVWKDVISLVDNFESDLAAWLQHASSSPPTPVTSKGKGRANDDVDETSASRSDIVHRMDEVTDQLEYWVALAESKNWKLLVCCIGAELEAFKQAMSVLRESILGVQDGADEPASAADTHDSKNSHIINNSPHLLDSPELESSKPFEEEEGDAREVSHSHYSHSQTPNHNPTLFDAEDEPDPDLMLEKKDSTESDSEHHHHHHSGSVWHTM